MCIKKIKNIEYRQSILFKMTRPSPTESATKYKIGTKKKGNDNNTWIVVKTKNGIKRWKKLSNTPKIKGCKTYLIHDNGGRPFKVYVCKQFVIIYAMTNNQYYDKCVKLYNKPKKVFIGSDKGKFKGNSILIQINNYRYVYIGSNIYTFSTDDIITKYYSFVGNSDVPYPVAMSKDNAYFMLDYKYINKKYFPQNIDWNDSYKNFYTFKRNELKQISHKFKKTKIIHKRL